MRPLLATFLAAAGLLLTAADAAARLTPPVDGPVVRAFSYARGSPFAAGQHRGIDIAARGDAPVRAPCAGTVAFAGRIALPGVVPRAAAVRIGRAAALTARAGPRARRPVASTVSLLCGPWRVTLSPLAAPTARRGAAVRAGAPVGRLAGGVLQLGLRWERDPFGYVDPQRLLARRAPQAGPGPPAVAPPARRHTGPLAAPRSSPPRPLPAPRPAPPLPWPVWAGIALAACSATCGFALRRRRSGLEREPVTRLSRPWPSSSRPRSTT